MGKKITISPVTRIEGHAKITIHLDDDGKVEQSFFHVEQFRGFEKFSEGRMFYEMPEITPRICGICPVSHHLAAAKAADQVAGMTPTPTANKLRELMHMGQVIQSHGMHFFELAGPDLIFGFDADPKVRHVGGIVQTNPALAIKAIKLRAYGQEIIRRLGERRIHPIFAIPGGVTKPLMSADREWMLKGIDDQLATTLVGISFLKNWMQENQQVMDEFAVFPSAHMGLVQEDGALELYGGQLRIVDQDGELLEQFDPCNYLDYIGERVNKYTYLKSPYYKQLGYPAGIYRVGPLGRLNAASHISTPLAQSEMKIWKSLNGGKPVEGTLYFHYARLIDILYALERTRELLEDPDILNNAVVGERGAITGEGVGCIEAPRGTLFHHYWTDDLGVIQRVNLIVATAGNAWSMNHSVNMVAKRYVDGNQLTEGMLNRVEAAIRAHDPCLSCSTHAMGQMPMHIELYSPAGELLDTVHRD
ncbi:MAG TPA: Ni/Fe hydrogenase subunit alpha [Thermoflexia bacterium]|nr:Ni/Fe hydrogenase subunit alpha [Thermoflexia bacterium]